MDLRSLGTKTMTARLPKSISHYCLFHVPGLSTGHVFIPAKPGQERFRNGPKTSDKREKNGLRTREKREKILASITYLPTGDPHIWGRRYKTKSNQGRKNDRSKFESNSRWIPRLDRPAGIQKV